MVGERPEPMPDAALVEHELAYTETAVRFVRERVQLVLEEDQYRVHGAGELLTSLVPVLDRAMVNRGAAMIHAATVAYQGQAIALPAAGGTGKTSTVAKLMRREGWTFMGDDWAFLSEDASCSATRSRCSSSRTTRRSTRTCSKGSASRSSGAALRAAWAGSPRWSTRS